MTRLTLLLVVAFMVAAPQQCLAAISASAVWEVRTTGNDANGGLYASGGTDYSQQDAAQLSVADAVTNGTTTVTSVTGGFTAAMVGNGINIAGVVYQIATRVDANTITVDRTVAAASGQTAKVGGALASPGFCSGNAVTSNYVWLKAGTYTLTSGGANIAGGRVVSPGGTAASPFRWEGYQTTRGDKGTKPAINEGAAVGINMFATGAAFTQFDNIEFTVVDSNSVGVDLQSSSCRAIRCKCTGAGDGFYVPSQGCSLLYCESSCLAYPFDLHANVFVVGCVAHGGTTGGFMSFNDNVVFVNCIAYGNGAHGFDSGPARLSSFMNCTSYGNGGSGFYVSSAGASIGYGATNCVSTANANYGFESASSSGYFTLFNCATYLNTSGAVNNLPSTENLIVLTANPFVSAPTNFGLNTVAGGGLLCRAAGVLGVFPGLAATIGYMDIGAVQHADSGTGGGGRRRIQ